MRLSFASIAIFCVVVAVCLRGASGAGWTIKVASSSLAGTYPAVGGVGSPGSRYNPSNWEDPSGNLWMFGGFGYGTDGTTGNDGDLNDIWSWNGTSWFFWGGATTTNSLGTSTQPQARDGAGAWADASGNLYLYGGVSSATQSTEYLSDMWVFSTTTHAWTRLRASTSNQAGTYPSSAGGTGQPGSLSNPGTWVDQQGNFWLFGGGSNTGEYNDLWKYVPATATTYGTWYWYNGAKQTGSTGTYPSGNTGTGQPPSRQGPATFLDTSNNLWMFGGATLSGTYYNDMWEYIISTNTWTLTAAGTKTPNNVGTYNGIGAAGIPKARGYPAYFTDTSGNFWIFGGLSIGTTYLFDFWKYSGGTWTLVGGSAATSQPAVYGGMNAYPGSREQSVGWVDKIGQFWMFGGLGYTNIPNALTDLNEMWVYNGAPLLTTSSVSTSSTSATTLATTSSASTSATSTVHSTSTTSAASTANIATTGGASTTVAASSSSSASAASTTVALSSSTSASTGNLVTGAQSSTSSTAAASTTAAVSSSSTASVSSSTVAATSTISTTLTQSTATVASTLVASSTSSVSTSVTAGGATATSQTASTSLTASSSSKFTASTSASTTGNSATSSASTFSTLTASSSTSNNAATALSASSSASTTATLSTSLASLTGTGASSTVSASTSATLASSSSTSKAVSLISTTSTSSQTVSVVSGTSSTSVTASIQSSSSSSSESATALALSSSSSTSANTHSSSTSTKLSTTTTSSTKASTSSTTASDSSTLRPLKLVMIAAIALVPAFM